MSSLDAVLDEILATLEARYAQQAEEESAPNTLLVMLPQPAMAAHLRDPVRVCAQPCIMSTTEDPQNADVAVLKEGQDILDVGLLKKRIVGVAKRLHLHTPEDWMAMDAEEAAAAQADIIEGLKTKDCPEWATELLERSVRRPRA